jgi:hypothetical protein
MKARKVVVVLELETSMSLKDLRDRDLWDSVIGDWSSVRGDVVQVQVNVQKQKSVEDRERSS